MEEIRAIFTESKESTARHQKLLQKLEKLRERLNEKLFFDEFFNCIRIIFHMDLKVNKVEVNRVMLFAVKFSIKRLKPLNESDEDDEMDGFLKQVLYEALKYHNIDSVTVRYRCCQFITTLLKEMGDEGIDGDAWDAIQDAMLERLNDPKALIRLQAVTALFRLQVPTDNECPVIASFINCLYDSSAAVSTVLI